LLLHKKFGFAVPDILKLIDYGFRSAFVDETLKKCLRIEAFLKAMNILSKYHINVTGIDSSYYTQLGLTIPLRFLPPVRNPPLTLKLLKQFPKCDLDCRLIGSVPFPLLFEFYQKSSKNQKQEFQSIDQLINYCTNESDQKMRLKAKELSISLLQTEENLKKATLAILQEAFNDRVIYLELTVCPLLHTRLGLTPNQVLDCILEKVKEFRKGHNMKVSIVINANLTKFSPIEVHRLAQLTVSYLGKGVVGFATTTAEISVSEMKFYETIFNYLSENFVPVTIFAGEKQADSVTISLVHGHARRISGGFKITQSESVLNDITSHNTAILVSSSTRMQEAIEGWKKSPIRYFFDFGVKLAFCSIHNTFKNMSRSEQLFAISKESGFDAISIMNFIDNTFQAAFIHHHEITAFQRLFWKRAIEILEANNFKSTIQYSYFPPLE